MCWAVEKLIRNEEKILGLKCFKKEVFHFNVIWSTNQGEQSGLEFECFLRLRMTMESEEGSYEFNSVYETFR